MILAISLYSVGFLGFILNRRHILLALLSIELMLLAVTVLIITASYHNSDLPGQVLGIYAIVLAGAESAIGLAFVVSYHKNHGQIYLA